MLLFVMVGQCAMPSTSSIDGLSSFATAGPGLHRVARAPAAIASCMVDAWHASLSAHGQGLEGRGSPRLMALYSAHIGSIGVHGQLDLAWREPRV